MTTDRQWDHFATARKRMVETQLRARGIGNQRVLAAMGKVPRHSFVADLYKPSAYEDHPLPIGEEQTVSQPYMVAYMLEALELGGSETVLEIGTGSGYQTALLAELAQKVYSMERVESLAHGAQAILQRLGYANVRVAVGDGSRGLIERAPFDAIVVSAAAPHVPHSLLEQLREAGRMVVPVGPAEAQVLKLVRKQQGRPVVTNLEGCRFVPLIGKEGYDEGW